MLVVVACCSGGYVVVVASSVNDNVPSSPVYLESEVDTGGVVVAGAVG